jgi:hypothetical protein
MSSFADKISNIDTTTFFIPQEVMEEAERTRIMEGLNEYADEPLDFEDFDFKGYINWGEKKVEDIFGDWDEFFDWSVSNLEEEGVINWEGAMDWDM